MWVEMLFLVVISLNALLTTHALRGHDTLKKRKIFTVGECSISETVCVCIYRV